MDQLMSKFTRSPSSQTFLLTALRWVKGVDNALSIVLSGRMTKSKRRIDWHLCNVEVLRKCYYLYLKEAQRNYLLRVMSSAEISLSLVSEIA